MVDAKLTAQRKAMEIRHKEKHGVTREVRRRRKHPRYRISFLVKAARKRAKAAGLPHTITPDDLYIPTHCPILGVELDYVNLSGKLKDNSPSLDRVENSLGYVPGNVRVISFAANRLKKNYSADTFRKLIAYMEGLI